MSELKDQDPDYGPSLTNTEKQQRLYEENARISTARKITAIIEKEFSHEITSKEKEIFEIQNRLQRALKTLHLLRYVIVTDFYNRKQCKLQTESRQIQPHPAVKGLIGKRPKSHFGAITNSEGNLAAETQTSNNLESAAKTYAKSCFPSHKDTLQKTEPLRLDQQEQEDCSRINAFTCANSLNKDSTFNNFELQGNCSKSYNLEISTEEKCFNNLSVERNISVNGLPIESVEREVDYNNFDHNNSNDSERLLDKHIKDNIFQTSKTEFIERNLHLEKRKISSVINFDTLSSNNSENSSSNYFDNITERNSKCNSFENFKGNGIEKCLSSNNFEDNLIDTSLNQISVNNESDSKEAPKKIPRYIPPKSTSPSSSPSRLRQKVRKRLIIGNISKWIPPEYREDNSTHKWTIYVQGNRENRNIDYISKVRFFLHPSYRPNDVIEVSNYPFCISRRGWGEFPIRIQLHFKNLLNKPVDVIHYLKLDKSYTGLQTLGSETVVDVWIYEENDKAKRKAICIEKDSEETLENIHSGERCKRKCIGSNLDLLNEECKNKKNLRNLFETGEVKKQKETTEGPQSNKHFFRNSISISKSLCMNYTQEDKGKDKSYRKEKHFSENLVETTQEEKPVDQHSYKTYKAIEKLTKCEQRSPEKKSLLETNNTIHTDHDVIHKTNALQQVKNSYNYVKAMSNTLTESGVEVFENSTINSRTEQSAMKDQACMFETCTENLKEKVGLLKTERVLEDFKQLETRSVSNNLIKLTQYEEDDALQRIRSAIFLDHDYVGSISSEAGNHMEQFLEIEKTLQTTVKDRMTKLTSNLQPLKISIPSPFEGSSKKVLVLQDDKTIPVEITSKLKNKLAGRSLLKKNSNNINEAINNPENKKSSSIFQMNSKTVIFDVNSSVPTLKIADVPLRNGTETKNSYKEDKSIIMKEGGTSGKNCMRSETLEFNEIQLHNPLKINVENETQEWSATRQENQNNFNSLKQMEFKSEDSLYKLGNTQLKVEDVQTLKPKLTIGKDKHKLQNKRELYTETLAHIDSVQLFGTESFLRFVMTRLPLITDNATDPEYRKIHSYSCTSEKEYFSFSIAKQRAMEWHRAKFAREFLKKKKSNTDIWSIKEILMWARFHGYSPVHTQAIQESLKNISSCFNSVTEPQEFIKWKDSNPINSADPDIVSSINIVDVESDKEKEENEEKRLEILEIEKKLVPLYGFVSTTTREIGLKLQPEEIVPNIAYCAAARMLMRAVECLVDDLLRSSLAKAWERHDYSGCPNVISLGDVRRAIQNREEFSLFTNSGLGSIYRPPKD